jgi:transposase
MTKPLSLDLRQRVIGAIDGGLSCRAAAKRFGIARSAVVKWRRIWLDTGSVAPRAQGGDTRSGRIEAVGPAILGMVAEAPGLTLVEIAERLEREHGERFAPSIVHRFLHRRGWSFRRSPSMPPSRIPPTTQVSAPPGSRHGQPLSQSG